MRAGASTLVHLVRRFLGSLSPRPLADVDDAWARSHLLAGEGVLWEQMSRADRKHSVAVARVVQEHLPADVAARPVLAAALLHDVGKIDAGLGTPGRVVATVAGRSRAARWRDQRGLPGRIARYLHHDQIGAELLAAAGADELTVAWAAEHHRPEGAWTVPVAIGRVLRDADDD